MKYETLFKKIIVEKELSYRIISRITGISRTSLCNYANGYRKPDLETACQIIRKMQFDSELIFTLFEPTD